MHGPQNVKFTVYHLTANYLDDMNSVCNITLVLIVPIFFSVPLGIVSCCVESFHHVTA